MGIKAEFNPSTALMHFTDATKRVQVVGLIPGFGPNDYCCFLDPDPAIWDSGTTYSQGEEAAFVAGSFVYRSLTSGNLNNPLDNALYWFKSLGTSCNNAGWDSYPPYGGVSKTPELYEVTITDIPAIFISATDGTLIPAAVNGTHILTSDIPQAIFEESWFVIISNATTTGKDVWLWVRPHPVLRSVSMGTLSNSVFGFNIDSCELFGSHVVTDEPMDYTVEWNPF